MNWTTVVLKTADLNITMAGIEYSYWGQVTKQSIIVCDTWEQGFQEAKQKGYSHALFVRSGTVFVDWAKWKLLLEQYPHQGLIGHLICHPGQPVYLDDQCWFVDLTQFDLADLTSTSVKYPAPIRSDQNMHDDYTPLWIKPGSDTVDHSVTHFGQGLIARNLNNKKIVCNWSNAARDLKFFCYPATDFASVVRQKFLDYYTLSENQLWVFNNEELNLISRSKLITPGSGLFWMLNMVQDITEEIQIVDISQTQLNFCNELWTQWNGQDYGSFVWNFIKKYQLKHYELDQANLSDIERLKLKNSDNFKLYVNQKFDELLSKHHVVNFSQQWTTVKQHKILKLTRANLVHWMLDNPDQYNNLWSSNILNYKWTKLNTTWNDYEKFQKLSCQI